MPRPPFGLFKSSLRIKFALLVGVILAVLFGLSSFVLIRQNVATEKNSLLDKASVFAELSTKSIGDDFVLYYESGQIQFNNNIDDILLLNSDITRIQIISTEGKILFDTIDSRKPPLTTINSEDKDVLDKIGSVESAKLLNQDGEVASILTPYFDDFGTRSFSIRYFISYESVYQRTNQTIQYILALTLFAFCAGLFAIFLLVNFAILRPLGHIVDTAARITRGDLKQRIELRTGDELERLADSLNQMTNSLRSDIEKLKRLDVLKNQFIILASHNLRTPVTIIRGYADALGRNKSLNENARDTLSKIMVGTRDLQNLTESLLEMVSLEKGQKSVLKEEVDLNLILERVVSNWKDKASNAQIKLILRKSVQPLRLILDQRLIEQAFTNLIDNAIKFNRKGGEVEIKTELRDNVLVSIRDTGIGIEKEKYQEIFSKFYKATGVLTFDYEGAGIGLYLTKLIVQANDGKIWFESTKDKGTTFFVEFPSKEEHSKD